MTLSPAAGAAQQTQPAAVWLSVTQDLGAAALEGDFTLTDARITAGSLVVIVPTAIAGPEQDEATMDPLACVAVPYEGYATVYWTTLGSGRVSGERVFLYSVS